MFEEIYNWFTQFCCVDTVKKALDTIKCTEEVITDTGTETAEIILLQSGYLQLGITTLVISFLICFAFYIWPLDHPRFKAWWAWLTTAGVNSLLAFLIGLIYAKVRLGGIDDDAQLQYHMEHNNEYKQEDYTDLVTNFNDFNFGDYVSVGLTNVFVALLFFIFFSLCLNWFGKSTKYSPFRK